MFQLLRRRRTTGRIGRENASESVGTKGNTTDKDRREVLLQKAAEIENRAEHLWAVCESSLIVDTNQDSLQNGENTRMKPESCFKCDVCALEVQTVEGSTLREAQRIALPDEALKLRREIIEALNVETGSNLETNADLMQASSRLFVLCSELADRKPLYAWIRNLECARASIYASELSLQQKNQAPNKSPGADEIRIQLSKILSDLDGMSWNFSPDQRLRESIKQQLITQKRNLVRRILFLVETELEEGAISKRDKMDTMKASSSEFEAVFDDANVTCVICEEEERVLIAPCQHRCCKTCWAEWLSRNKSCPLCRRYVHPSQLQDRLRREEIQGYADRVDLSKLSKLRK